MVDKSKKDLNKNPGEVEKIEIKQKTVPDKPSIGDIKIDKLKDIPIKQLKRDKASWDELLKIYRDNYAPRANLKSEIKKLRVSIESGMENPKKQTTYSIFHVSSLLAEARGLLEDGINQREKWRDLSEKQFSLTQEIKEFLELDKIHKKEIDSGYYKLPYQKAALLRSAESWISFWNDSAVKRLQWYNDAYLTKEKIKDYKIGFELTAKATPRPLFTKDDDNNYRNYIFSWRGKTYKGDKDDLLLKFAELMSSTNIEGTDTNFYVQKLSNLASKRSSLKREEAHKIEEDWAKKDAVFRLQRTQVSRDLMDLRVLESTRPGGWLHYKEMKKPIEDRFNKNLVVATDMLMAASKGLYLIYGITEPSLPSFSSSGYYDSLLSWVITVQHKLNSFRRHEQDYAYPISVKAFIGEKAFNNLKNAGLWEFKLSQKDNFRDQFHVRIQGLSAYIRGESKGLWNLKITPPNDAFVRISHINGRHQNLDQSKIPPAIIKRVSQRNSTRDPDVVGMSALNNISPIGNWRISLDKNSHIGESRDMIEDIEIDLYIVMRQK